MVGVSWENAVRVLYSKAHNAHTIGGWEINKTECMVKSHAGGQEGHIRCLKKF